MAPRRPSGRPTRAPGPHSVLVVDHDPFVCRIVERLLARRGYRVRCACGADEALEILGEHREDVDLILVDLTVPGMSGPELARRALEADGEVKVLYLSSYSERALREVGLEHPFLEKPLDSTELDRAVDGILSGRPTARAEPRPGGAEPPAPGIRTRYDPTR